MTRVEWFKENVEHFAIYETYETEDFTDFFCRVPTIRHFVIHNHI